MIPWNIVYCISHPAVSLVIDWVSVDADGEGDEFFISSSEDWVSGDADKFSIASSALHILLPEREAVIPPLFST